MLIITLNKQQRKIDLVRKRHCERMPNHSANKIMIFNPYLTCHAKLRTNCYGDRTSI